MEQLSLPGCRVELHAESHTLLDGCFFVSGAIPRVMPYEVGAPLHVTRRNWAADQQSEGGVDGEAWARDPLIMDERFVAVRIKGEALAQNRRYLQGRQITLPNQAQCKAQHHPRLYSSLCRRAWRSCLFVLLSCGHCLGGEARHGNGHRSRTISARAGSGGWLPPVRTGLRRPHSGHSARPERAAGAGWGCGAGRALHGMEGQAGAGRRSAAGALPATGGGRYLRLYWQELTGCFELAHSYVTLTLHWLCDQRSLLSVLLLHSTPLLHAHAASGASHVPL